MPLRRSFLFTAALLAAFALSATCAWAQGSARAAGVPLAGRWQLTFQSSFAGHELNGNQWNPNWFGSSPISITDPVNAHDQNCNTPAQVTVSGGLLRLGVSHAACPAPNGTTYPYAGSLLDTLGKFQFTYGYLKARVFVPRNALGDSADNVAFWADGTGDWPATGELDVMEILAGCGPHGTDGFAYHFHSPQGAPGGCARAASTPGWHTFAADWEPGRVTYYYDGHRVGTVTRGVTSAPMYLILDQSADPSPGRRVPAAETALVKYVQVWQRQQ